MGAAGADFVMRSRNVGASFCVEDDICYVMMDFGSSGVKKYINDLIDFPNVKVIPQPGIADMKICFARYVIFQSV